MVKIRMNFKKSINPFETEKKNRLPDYSLYNSFSNFYNFSALLLCEINVLDFKRDVTQFWLLSVISGQ